MTKIAIIIIAIFLISFILLSIGLTIYVINCIEEAENDYKQPII